MKPIIENIIDNIIELKKGLVLFKVLNWSK